MKVEIKFILIFLNFDCLIEIYIKFGVLLFLIFIKIKKIKFFKNI